MTQTSYRGYVIRPTFTPVRAPALFYQHKDFDGYGDTRCGYADSEDEARMLIDEEIDSDC